MTEEIRHAVGAIITQNNKVLLVRKVKMMDAIHGAVDIDPLWDFPKGGLKNHELNDCEDALKRELYEELGSKQFTIDSCMPDFTFYFDQKTSIKLGFKKQITKMFKVHFTGSAESLAPQDDEIDRIIFLSKKDALDQVTYDNSRQYLVKYL